MTLPPSRQAGEYAKKGFLRPLERMASLCGRQAIRDYCIPTSCARMTASAISLMGRRASMDLRLIAWKAS